MSKLLTQVQSNVGGVFGTVINQETQQPIQGALVEVLDAQGEVVATDRTDTFGNFTIEGLPPGTYTLRVSAKGFTTYTQQVTVVANEIEQVSIALTVNPPSITGFVCDVKTGERLANILIEVFNNQGALIANTLTDVNGQYAIFNLPIGVFKIKASAKYYVPESKNVLLVAGETKVVDFALLRKQRLPSPVLIDPKEGKLVQEILDQLFSISTNITSIWIKDSYKVKIQSTDTQIATSLQLSLQLVIALVVNIIVEDTNTGNHRKEKQQSNTEQINNRKIIIDNSKDVTVLITDMDFVSSIEILLQILLVLLAQLAVL
ncbi:carboxypeptidase regulatory-like domain-containing protein [Priestia aryabhattai]|uniref:Carboxypeptidase regulatory-like domain-containing protein n=1 Tax=Priestia aryabhattai TaxID=412384 RepID=A0ABD7X4L5_PRIAR|nr:carboxypeptidase regulatory-like domain-containing protein [Priestia aryabhattai]WEA47251.1 carboxypeptidase regulatory-like domain-containing protein [Priestia aryabhattai]